MKCIITDGKAESARSKSENGIKMPTWLIGFVTFLGLAVASSEASFAQVSGTFAFTSTQDCIVVFSPATFNSEFQATGAPVFHSIANNLGVITYNTNGTGNAEILLGMGNFMPIPPGNFDPTNSSASSYTITWQFTYTVSSGIITTTMVNGSFMQKFLAGPRAGQTGTQDVMVNYAYISEDGNNFLALSSGPLIDTKTYSNGDVWPEVCTLSARGFKP
jgi:hypothetical protein